MPGCCRAAVLPCCRDSCYRAAAQAYTQTPRWTCCCQAYTQTPRWTAANSPHECSRVRCDASGSGLSQLLCAPSTRCNWPRRHSDRRRPVPASCPFSWFLMILFLVSNDIPIEPLQDSIFCVEQIFQGVFAWSAVLSILLNRVNDARQVI